MSQLPKLGPRRLASLAATIVLIGGVLGGLAVGMLGVGPAQASGLGATCANSGTFFGGFENDSPAGWGARATLTHYLPTLCTGSQETSATNPSTSSVWALMGNSANGDLAQSGWLKDGHWSTTNEFYFFECISCNYVGGGTMTAAPVELQQVSNPTSYASTDQMSTWQNGSGTTTMQVAPVNDTGLSGTIAGYAAINGWSPNTYQWYGENHWIETQTPGDATHPVTFSAVQGLNGSSWQTMNINSLYNGSDAPHGANKILASAGSFEIWDTR